MRRVLFSLVFCLSLAALAEDRPSEDSMFGASAAKAPPPKDAFATGEVKDNAVTVSGLYYQRFIVSPQEGRSASTAPASLPMQFDALMDARPNDRVRGYIDGRLFFDASREPSTAGGFQFSSGSTAANRSSTTASNPQVALDQAWLKFDINRAIFVTAGKQHIKWGASRFWNPTDFLHTQVRDPLLTSDLRLGNTMVKLAMPFESHSSSLYAVALFDNPVPAASLGQIGGAFRAETVVMGAEIGVEALFRSARTPTYGADVSMPLGPFDVYAEAALYSSQPFPHYQINSGLATGADLSTIVGTTTQREPVVQVSAGANFQFAWKENRQATVGVEYFYNELGYTDGKVYPALIFFGQYRPFYTGRDYAAIYVMAEGPDSGKNTNYTLSTLANISDASFITRLDFSWRILTYLTIESFAGVHYGTRGGEFRFALNTPSLTYQGNTLAPIDIPPTVVDLGMGLRLSF